MIELVQSLKTCAWSVHRIGVSSGLPGRVTNRKLKRLRCGAAAKF